MEYNVNTSLERNILPGNQYDKYFDTSWCKIMYLGRGDTSLTMKKMKVWSEKYAHHTQKLALKEFSNKSLPQLITDIHKFLFWHIQYNQDAEEQNLKSPGCAWSSRKEGFDCKGYSIFASSILQNLGIKHYLRRVRQPNILWPHSGTNPKLWSHVYVIVPLDQKSLKISSKADYLVIDATIASNNEVAFIDSRELKMSNVSLKHYGLAGASGLNACSCHKKPQRKNYTTKDIFTKLRTAPREAREAREAFFRTAPREAREALRGASPQEQQLFQQAYANFTAYLQKLVQNGMPVSMANLAATRLKKFIQAGVEPTMKDLFAVPATKSQLNGLGIPGQFTAPLLTNINQLPFSSSVRRGTGNIGKKFNLGPISTALSVVTSIIPKEIYDKTFGALFANGFNFKCWGATWNPDKAQRRFEEWSPKILQRAQQVINSPIQLFTKAVNDYWVWFYSIEAPGRDWLATSAKHCTKDGLGLLMGSLDGLRRTIAPEFTNTAKAHGYLLKSATSTKKTYGPDSAGRHRLTINVEQFRIEKDPNAQTNITNGFIKVNSGSFVDGAGNLNLDNKKDIPKTTDQAGFGLIAGVAIAAIAAGTYIYTNDSQTKKKQINN